MTEHPNLAAALVAALAELTVVDKGRTANAGSYSYEYASIEDVVKRSRPVLAEHGVVALTPLHDHGTGLACTVVFLHTSGERIDFGPFPFPAGRDAQATGSMVTYHRRYALVAALGMAAGDDDDGAAAKPRQEQPARKPLAGWQSLEEQDEAHADFQSTVKAMSEEVQAHMRDFRKEAGFSWPMPKTDLDVMCDQLASVFAVLVDENPEQKRAERAAQVASESGSELAARAAAMAAKKAAERGEDVKAKAAGEGPDAA